MLRRLLAGELRRLARLLDRVAAGIDGYAPAHPGSPPEHWVAMVRSRAPALLHGDGIGLGPDGPRGASTDQRAHTHSPRARPTGPTAPAPRPGVGSRPGGSPRRASTSAPLGGSRWPRTRAQRVVRVDRWPRAWTRVRRVAAATRSRVRWARPDRRGPAWAPPDLAPDRVMAPPTPSRWVRRVGRSAATTRQEVTPSPGVQVTRPPERWRAPGDPPARGDSHAAGDGRMSGARWRAVPDEPPSRAGGSSPVEGVDPWRRSPDPWPALPDEAEQHQVPAGLAASAPGRFDHLEREQRGE